MLSVWDRFLELTTATTFFKKYAVQYFECSILLMTLDLTVLKHFSDAVI